MIKIYWRNYGLFSHRVKCVLIKHFQVDTIYIIGNKRLIQDFNNVSINIVYVQPAGDILIQSQAEVIFRKPL